MNIQRIRILRTIFLVAVTWLGIQCCAMAAYVGTVSTTNNLVFDINPNSANTNYYVVDQKALWLFDKGSSAVGTNALTSNFTGTGRWLWQWTGGSGTGGTNIWSDLGTAIAPTGFTNAFQIYYNGSILSGPETLGAYGPAHGNEVFVSYALNNNTRYAALFAQDSLNTNQGSSAELSVSTNVSNIAVTWRNAAGGTRTLSLNASPDPDFGILMSDPALGSQFVVAAPTGYTGSGTNWLGDDGKYHSTTFNTNGGNVAGTFTVPYYPRASGVNTLTDGALYASGADVALDSKFIWGPGTTNAVYRSGQGLWYENEQPYLGVTEAFGSVTNAFLTLLDNQATLSSDSGVIQFNWMLSSGKGIGLAGSAVLPSPGDDTIDIGSSTSAGAFKDIYFKGTNYVEASNDGAGNYSWMRIFATNGIGIFDYDNAGSGTPWTKFSFRSNGVEVAALPGTGGGTVGTLVTNATLVTGDVYAVGTDPTNAIKATSFDVERTLNGNTNTVIVSALATAGDGSAGSPWTGWDTTSLSNAFTTYRWPSGNYSFSSTIDLLGTNTLHLGEAGTILHYTGSGTAVQWSAGTNWVQVGGMENFVIECSGATRPTKVPTAIVASHTSTENLIATVTLVNHGYSTGMILDMSGAGNSDFNGVRPITVTDPDHFTYKIRSELGTPTAVGTFQSRVSSVALRLIGVRDGNFKNLVFKNCSLGFETEACVTDAFENIIMTYGSSPQLVSGGLLCQRDVVLGHTTTCYFKNLVIEGVSDYGLILFEAANCTFSGTSEGNGAGVMVNYNWSWQPVFESFDIEACTTGIGATIYGRNVVLKDCFIIDNVYVNGGIGFQVRGGSINGALVIYGSYPTLINANLAAASYANNADFPLVLNCSDMSGSAIANVLPGPQVIQNPYSGPVALSVNGYSGQTNDVFKVTSGATNYFRVKGNGDAYFTNGVTHFDAAKGLELGGTTITAWPAGGAGIVGTVSNNVASAGLLAVDSTKTNGIVATKAHITNAWNIFDGDTAKFVNGAGNLSAPAGGGNMVNTGASAANDVPVYTDGSGTALTPTNTLFLTGLSVTNRVPFYSGIFVPNATNIVSRNGVNSADVPLIGIDTNDVVQVSDATHDTTLNGQYVHIPGRLLAGSAVITNTLVLSNLTVTTLADIDSANFGTIYGSNWTANVAAAFDGNTNLVSTTTTTNDLLSLHNMFTTTGATVAGPILTTSPTTNGPSTLELASAGWVRSLLNNGTFLYNSTNVVGTAFDASTYLYVANQPTNGSRSYTPAAGDYIGSVMTTQRFEQVSGPVHIASWFTSSGGGRAAHSTRCTQRFTTPTTRTARPCWATTPPPPKPSPTVRSLMSTISWSASQRSSIPMALATVSTSSADSRSTPRRARTR